MKIICISLLMVAALQLSITGHLATNPIANKTFVVTATMTNNPALKNVPVQFDDDQLVFSGECDTVETKYKIGDNNTFSVRSLWTTKTKCEGIKDPLLKSLWAQATSYSLSGKVLKVFNKEGISLITLRQTN